MRESLEFAKDGVLQLMKSKLNVQIRVDRATKDNLEREIDNGCDLLIYYGHGTDEGSLVFEDTYLKPSNINTDRWSSLKGFICFACNSIDFTQNIPCPWVAFSESIYVDAPKGYFRAFIQSLRNNPMNIAIGQAKGLIEKEMNNNMPGSLAIGSTPWPNLNISNGNPELLRLSPVLAQHYHCDFLDPVIDSPVDYPEHNPYIGHEDELELLFNIPTPFSGENEQALYWIWGNPGIGKSAFLRQYTSRMRDYYFHEVDQPVYVFQVNCWGYANEESLKTYICDSLIKLYQVNIRDARFEDIIKEIAPLRARHVWILDDLSDLDIDKSHANKAIKFVGQIVEMIKNEALSLTLIVSNRQFSDQGIEIKINELSQLEAEKLATKLYFGRFKQLPTKEIILGALSLFERTGRVTGIYKRSLIMALESDLSFSDYALEIGKLGKYETLGYFEFTQKIMDKEIVYLDAVSSKFGFKFVYFLQICYPLIDRVAYFSLNELQSWFKNRFVEEFWTLNTHTAYQNGVKHLSRIGILTSKEDPATQEIIYTIPPNQREILRSKCKTDIKLPEDLPIRDPQSRLAMAMEAAKSIGIEALPKFQVIISDYQENHNTIEKLDAYMMALSVAAEFYEQMKLPVKQIETLNQIKMLGSGHEEKKIVEYVVTAMYNIGVWSMFYDCHDRAVENFKEVYEQYHKSPNVDIFDLVLSAVINLGAIFVKNGQSNDAIDIYNLIFSLYKQRTEADYDMQISEIMNNLDATWNLSDPPQGLDLIVYNFKFETPNDVLEINRNPIPRILHQLLCFRSPTKVVTHIITVVGNLGSLYYSIYRTDEAILCYETIISLFKYRQEPIIVEQMVEIMANLGAFYSSINNLEAAIKTSNQVISLYRNLSNLNIAMIVAEVMFKLGDLYDRSGNTTEEKSSYQDVISIYRNRLDLHFVILVLLAMFNLGKIFSIENNSEKAIQSYNEILLNYQNRNEIQIFDIVEKAKEELKIEGMK